MFEGNDSLSLLHDLSGMRKNVRNKYVDGCYFIASFHLAPSSFIFTPAGVFVKPYLPIELPRSQAS